MRLREDEFGNHRIQISELDHKTFPTSHTVIYLHLSPFPGFFENKENVLTYSKQYSGIQYSGLNSTD
jgi:hypothetical protein